MPFASCMSIPQEMSLKTIGGELFLCAEPVSEVKLLYTGTEVVENRDVSAETPFHMQTHGRACDISLTVRFSEQADWRFSLYGFTIEVSNKTLRCGDCSIPVRAGKLELRILLDTLCAEVFTDQGSVFLGMPYIQDSNLNSLTVSVSNAPVLIEKLSVSMLKSFWA